MENLLAELKRAIAADVAAECAEYDRIDSERMQEQIKKRPGQHESINGFYAISDTRCGPMRLLEDYHFEWGSGKKIIDWPVKTLFHSSGHITIFLNQDRAAEAIRATEKRIEQKRLSPLSSEYGKARVVSTAGEGLVYHFFDTDEKIWLPTSELIEICDELPQKR